MHCPRDALCSNKKKRAMRLNVKRQARNESKTRHRLLVLWNFLQTSKTSSDLTRPTLSPALGAPHPHHHQQSTDQAHTSAMAGIQGCGRASKGVVSACLPPLDDEASRRTGFPTVASRCLKS